MAQGKQEPKFERNSCNRFRQLMPQMDGRTDDGGILIS